MRNRTRPQGCCVPSRFTLHCRVLTSSQTSSDQREKLSSAPLSFNIPNTSAWNNRANTSHCLLLACCLVCLSCILPWNLSSPHWYFGAFLLPLPHTLLPNCWFAWLKTALSDVISSASSSLTTLSWPLSFWNTGTDTRVFLPPRDVCQQQRLQSRDEGRQDRGLWRGTASLGQETRRLRQDQQDGKFQCHVYF